MKSLYAILSTATLAAPLNIRDSRSPLPPGIVGLDINFNTPSNGILEMALTWNYSCTPDLLPLKRRFNLSDYPHPNRLVTTVKQVDELATKGEYGLALLQWYNVTDYSARNETLLGDVLADISFNVSPGESKGLKCILKAMQDSPTQSKEVKEIERTLQEKNSKNSVHTSNTRLALKAKADRQCNDRAVVHSPDCQQALEKAKDIVFTNVPHQFQHGSCFLVIDANGDHPSFNLQQSAQQLLTECDSSGGSKAEKWGRFCFSDRTTGC